MIIGKAIFRNDVKIKALPSQIQSLLKNDNFWAIDHRKYQKENWSLIFESLEEVTVRTLLLDYNCHSKILIEISHVSFSQLKELWIRQNRIDNIQPIEYIDAPCLELLRISINHISHLKPLVKMPSKSLREIYVPGNPVLDLHWLTRAHLSPTMNDIFLEYWSHNNVIGEDLSIMAKINANSIHDIWIKGEQRIGQSKVYPAINAKFPRTRLYKLEEE